MKQIRIFLQLAALIFTIAAFGQGTKSAPRASVPQVQQSQPPPTVALTVDRQISIIEKANCGSCGSHAGR